MTVPRRLVIAGVTAVTVFSVTGRILPQGRPGDAGTRDATSGYIEGQKQEEVARQLTRKSLQDAVNSDELASREAREAAGAAFRTLLRHP